MTDKDNITLLREVVEWVETLMKIANKWSDDVDILVSTIVDLRDDLTALRTALAAEPTKQEPAATVGTQSNAAWKGYDGRWSPPGDPIKVVHLLRDLPLGTLLYAAPPDAPTVKESLTHPGYVIGSHWLETAYSRICAGEAEADVLRDCGWERVADAEALRRDAERYRWLREKDGIAVDVTVFGSMEANLDAAIDAAMEGKR